MSECKTINCPTCRYTLDENFVEHMCPRCQALIESKFVCGSCHSCAEGIYSQENMTLKEDPLKMFFSIFKQPK